MGITTEKVKAILDEALGESIEEIDTSNPISESVSRVFNQGVKVMFDSALLKILHMEVEDMIR